MDNSLPDLVRDWELDTKFVSDKQTVHTTYVSDPARGRWRRAEEEVWDQTSMLGRGSFGVVSLQKCASGPNSGKVRAVKEIQVTLDQSSDKFLSREISAIVKFSHKRFRECFVPSFGWYRGQDSIFITMEYLPLGDLQSYLSSPLPESEARTITEQTLQGIEFMHQSKIAHRDLKPKNILVQHKGPNWWVKISDFGCSKQSELTSLRTLIGTESYLAPELQNIFAPSDREELEDEDDPDSPETPGYSLAVDMWALGAVTFRIVTGQVPFPSPVGRKLSRYVAHGGPFPPNELLSSKCRDFIVSVMSRSPRDRPSATKALADPWIVWRSAPEGVDSIPGPEIAAEPEKDTETRTDSPQTAFKEASGTWSTDRQSLPLQPKLVPDELQTTRIQSPDANEASGSWSTDRQSLPLQPKLIPDGLQTTRIQSSDLTGASGSWSTIQDVNEASGKWSTIQQSLPQQPKLLGDESRRTEPTQLTRPKSTDFSEIPGSWPTTRQNVPLRPRSRPAEPETTQPTRLQVSDLGDTSGSGLIAPRLPADPVPLEPIQIRSFNLLKSSLTRMFPLKLTSSLKARNGNYWTDKGFHGPPSECVFSQDGKWLVSVGKYGHYGGEVFCVWNQTKHGRFQQTGAYYSTSHSGRVKMALSSAGRRLSVVENTNHTGVQEEYMSTWELGPRGVFTLVNGFWDSKQRYANSWSISANTQFVVGLTNADDMNHISEITLSKPDSKGHLEIVWSKKLEFEVEDIACSPDGNRFVAFHSNMITMFSLKYLGDYEPSSYIPTKPGPLRTGVKKRSAFSPDGRFYIVSDDSTFTVFGRGLRGQWEPCHDGNFASQAVVFSPNSKAFALGSLNGAISTWKLDAHSSFREHKTVHLPIEGQLQSLAFSPCGKFLATTTESEFDIWEIF